MASAVGIAVLDAIKEDNCQENSKVIGESSCLLEMPNLNVYLPDLSLIRTILNLALIKLCSNNTAYLEYSGHEERIH